MHLYAKENAQFQQSMDCLEHTKTYWM